MGTDYTDKCICVICVESVIYLCHFGYLVVFLLTQLTIQLIMPTINVVKIKATIPEILIWEINFVRSQMAKILMTREKKPKVIMIKGRETSFKTGLTSALIKESTSPAINNVFQPPSNATPGKKYAAKYMASALANTLIIKRII